MPWLSSGFLLKFLNDKISQNSYNLFQEFPKSTDIFSDLVEKLTGLRHIVVLITNIYYEDMIKITVRSERENDISWRQKEPIGIFILSLTCESS